MKKQHIPKQRLTNKAGVAELFQVSLRAVDGWVRKGCPVREEGSRTKAWEFDLREVSRWLDTPADQSGSGGDFQAERTRLTREQADKLEIENRTRRGELYEAREYDKATAHVFKMIAATLETLPDILERDAGLENHQLEPVFTAIDRMREQLYREVIERKAAP